MNKISLIYTTFEDIDSAKNICKLLIENKLAACANIVKSEGLYFWDNKLNEGSEYIAFIKTSSNLKNQVIKYLENNHPYKVPLIAEYELSVNKKYFDWINNL